MSTPLSPRFVLARRNFTGGSVAPPAAGQRDSSISRSSDGFIRTPGAADNARYPPDESWKRPIDWIPRNEIKAAIINVVTDGVAIEQDELERVVRTVFGFRRLGPKIATAIQDVIGLLVKDGTLSIDTAGRYRLT